MIPLEDTANEFLPYDVLTNIPAQILQARNPGQSHREKDARLVHDALLLTFLVAMPFLQPKQIRQARICCPANIFKGPLSPFADIAVPEWAADELRCNPAAELWQICFSSQEKAGRALRVVLPHELIATLEEYLAVRSWPATTIPARSFLISVADASDHAS